MKANVSMTAKKNGPIDVGPEPDDVSLGGLSADIGFALRFAQIAVFNDLVAIFRPFDIRPGQYAALKIIQANAGLRPGQLGTLLNIQKPNLAALINHFERRGWVTKERTKGDGRLRTLILSPEGAAMLAEADAAHDAHRVKLSGIISSAEKEQLLHMLNRLAALGE